MIFLKYVFTLVFYNILGKNGLHVFIILVYLLFTTVRDNNSGSVYSVYWSLKCQYLEIREKLEYDTAVSPFIFRSISMWIVRSIHLRKEMCSYKIHSICSYS